jgi:eukaryotic-like serine/threonine-protein kinase
VRFEQRYFLPASVTLLTSKRLPFAFSNISTMTKVRDFLGPYRLARLIRLGSTCQVWEALDEGSGKRYAIKVLRPEQRGNKTEIGFLKHEYEIASQLNHKNVIKVIEYNSSTDTPFIVLDLFSEMNLKQAIRRGPEAIAYMLDKILLQVVESLYYFHTKGFVHCDVKPDNLLISRDGEIKLIDFTISIKVKTGWSKLFSKAAQVQGTRSYMSPEQIRNQSLDPRSDVYSLGCVFYELVTGKLPFTASSPNELLSKHLSAQVPSALVANENVSNEFNALIKAMMAKEVKDRLEMWDVLKQVRSIKIFKKPPRIPETSFYDDFEGGGRIEARS